VKHLRVFRRLQSTPLNNGKKLRRHEALEKKVSRQGIKIRDIWENQVALEMLKSNSVSDKAKGKTPKV
jgi:hypothetical protein